MLSNITSPQSMHLPRTLLNDPQQGPKATSAETPGFKVVRSSQVGAFSLIREGK